MLSSLLAARAPLRGHPARRCAHPCKPSAYVGPRLVSVMCTWHLSAPWSQGSMTRSRSSRVSSASCRSARRGARRVSLLTLLGTYHPAQSAGLYREGRPSRARDPFAGRVPLLSRVLWIAAHSSDRACSLFLLLCCLSPEEAQSRRLIRLRSRGTGEFPREHLLFSLGRSKVGFKPTI
jgi:hypothetical protein